jgi:hypothetical protein
MHIEELLRITTCKDAKDSSTYYQQSFEDICSKLLSEFTLCVGDTDRYRLLEVEAYLYDEDTHQDPYPHNHPKQRIPGRWYFHHVGMSAGFRGGSRKGLDVTIGDGRMACKGGLLIRAMQNVTSGTIIDGPCLLVDAILNGLKVKSINELVDTYFNHSEGAAGDQTSGFWLKHNPPTSSPIARKRPKTDDDACVATVYRSIRIGLVVKGKYDYLHRLDYVGRLYRFVVHPHLLRKGKIWLALELIGNSSLSTAEIATVLNVKQSIIQNYQDAFLEGRSQAMSVLKTCIRTRDMASGSSDWKCKALGALRWWEEQDSRNKMLFPSEL